MNTTAYFVKLVAYNRTASFLLAFEFCEFAFFFAVVPLGFRNVGILATSD